MTWQRLFDPFYASAFLWLGMLITSVSWLAMGVFRIKSSGWRWGKLLAPLATVVALSCPLWLTALIEEIQCRSAGLELDYTVDDPNASVYWQSFSPSPGTYSLGVLSYQGPLGSETMNELVRALAEGRLSFFEIPYEPIRAEVKEADRLNQKFFLAPASGEAGQCLSGQRFPQNALPAGTCIAFETSQGIQSRYEMRGQALVSEYGRDASIVDRKKGKAIASYKFVAIDTSETMLAMFGLRKLRPSSCKPAFSRRDLSTALIPLVFSSANAPRVDVEKLTQFRASTWKTVAAPPSGELIPKGAAGITYWLQKGAIRLLHQGDLDLWSQAAGPVKGGWIGVPDNVYLVTGDMRLPDGLYGGHSVTWVIAKDARIPPGPRGHSRFLQVGRGCIWAPTGCS